MKTIRLPAQSLEATFAAADASKEDRTVPMMWYTGAPVLQFNWENGLHNLMLSMESKAVRMKRLNSGKAPFTKGHADPNNPEATLGVIQKGSVQLDGEKGGAVVRFSKRADVEPIFQDVLDGVLPNVSVGAFIHRMKETTKEGEKIKSFLALDWEPYAVALVGVGGDAGAHFAAADKVEFTDCEVQFSAVGASAPQGNGMPNIEQPVEQQAVQITALGAKHDLVTLAAEYVKQGKTLADFQVAALTAIAAREELTPTRSHTASITRDQRDGLVDAMSESLASRFTGKIPGERAREFVGARISDLARNICQVHGLRPRSMDAAESIKLALTTSDYPLLLQGTGDRLLLNAYQQTAPAIKQIARQSSAADFRAKTLLRLSEMPDLLKVPEHGEITAGVRTETKESYRLSTFARQFALTRQAQINDDLGAWADYFGAFGAAAARLEGIELVALLAANAGLGVDMDDTVPLFDASHNNLIGSGTAINVDNLGIARMTMRLQVGIDGTTVLGIPPRFLVVPPQKETIAEQYLAQLAAAAASDVNPFGGRLALICISELSVISNTAWYLFADPGVAPVLEFAHLASAPGPVIETKPGWDVLGTAFRCYMDFGCGAIGTRGAVLNPGA